MARKKSSKKPPVDESTLSVEERLRRQRQREQRELAIKLRSEGKDYKEHKKAKKAAAAPVAEKRKAEGGPGKADDGDNKKARHYLGDKTPTWRPFDEVEVIVIPIFWNHDRDEKAGVMDAAEKVKSMLAAAGIKVDMDATNKYTPGQKMKYWETMGVKVRVELGPRDAENNRCIIAVAKQVGEVADKTPAKVGAGLVEAVQGALNKARSAPAEAQQQAARSKEAAEEQPESSGEGDSKEESEDEDASSSGSEESEDEESQPAAAKHKGGKAAGKGPSAPQQSSEPAKPQFRSADAEEDDFGELLFDAEEDEAMLTKEERTKKQRKMAKQLAAARKSAGRGDDDEGGSGGGSKQTAAEDSGKKKKARLVKF